MRRRVWHLLAAVSLLAVAAHAASRPRYGGTVRIETRASLGSYDPGASPSFDAADALRDRIAALVFDRLVTMDANGRTRPALAVNWQSDPDQRRWIFELRRGVKLHDGNLLPARLAAAALAAVHPAWRFSVQASGAGESLVIVSPDPQPNLLAELACTRNSIVARDAAGALIGSGPFRVQDWQPGRRATLVANSDYWGGRPFLQSIDITMGRGLRDQALDYRLERVDVIEVSPELAGRAAQEGERIEVSAPIDVLGIFFPPDSETPHLRQALSLAIDRTAIQTAILQRQGEAAGGLLPQWVSGYAFLFPARAVIDRARQEKNAAESTTIALAFDGNDPLQRAIAERVAVNARDAGLNVQPFAESSTSRAPASAPRLGALRLASSSAPVALAADAGMLGRADLPSTAGRDPESLYAAERSLLSESRFVPLVSVGEAFAVAPRLRNWHLRRDGEWNLADVWIQEAP